jgi:hypothetical protein
MLRTPQPGRLVTGSASDKVIPMSRWSFANFVATTLLLIPVTVTAQETKPAAGADPKLAAAGVAVLEKYCHRCHGVENRYPGLNMLDRATLLRPKDPNEEPFLVPGKLDESRIWQMVDAGEMPPEKQLQPSDEDKATLKRWIEAGAEFPPADRPTREFVGEDSVLEIIAKDLDSRRAEARRFVRYFALIHLWNAADVSDDELRLVRAGVSKLINSLSSQFRVAAPRQVDPDGLVLAVDLRDYGWTDKQWNRLLEAYPYGLTRGTDVARRVYELTACDLPYVRADWFIRTASRPPLYHDLLALPVNAKTLERDLGVDVKANFDNDRLSRAAFRKSGVSAQNRMVERHDARQGAYWKSYDFAKNVERADLFRFPLGPEFAGAQNRAAFKHDGGEIIYHLPNGLQGYLLIKNDDTRIDEGPIAIVNDPNQFSGSPAIVNGISCMGCHRDGMIRFEDTLRTNFSKLTGQPMADKVLRLYPPQDEMAQFVEGDRDRFLAACDKAVLPFLRDSQDDKRTSVDFPEPVTQMSERYFRRLSLDDVARELGLPKSPEKAEQLGLYHQGELATVIKVSNEMQRLGLAPLATGEQIARDAWENAYRRTARELKLGIPIDFSSAK